MLSKWPIRNKLLVGIALLLVIVATLSWSGFHGVYAYRSLVRILSGRADELPQTAALSRQVSDLRVIVGEVRSARAAAPEEDTGEGIDDELLGRQFAADLATVRGTLAHYLSYLDNNADRNDLRISDSRAEWVTVHKIEASLAKIVEDSADPSWMADEQRLAAVQAELDHLQALSWELPSFLYQRIRDFAGEVRTEYRTFIILIWVTSVLGAVLLGLLIRLFYAWIFRPLRVLIKGSRRVAAGEFGHRISLDTRDEMSELADAMNDMTARFETIRDGLDRQVRERTQQVVRSEQLASVGFLAAGVAHEINNPLASIALCAESLESRIHEAMEHVPEAGKADCGVISNYLRMIQDEAFRCKGITERLLDFARMGDATRQRTDLRELVQGVIDMVRHLGRYEDKKIEFAPGEHIMAAVNPQEIKQVVLNLVTNGLDSLDVGGQLSIELRKNRDKAEIVFTDNGCGMTSEVLEHLFEPFFTRRRNGQGIGLGLSITFRIVADHGGRIDVHSDGPGRGSRFCVSLPVASQQKETEHRYQAA